MNEATKYVTIEVEVWTEGQENKGIELYINDHLITRYFTGDVTDLERVLEVLGIESRVVH